MTASTVYNSSPGPLAIDSEGRTVDAYSARDDVDVDGRTADGKIARALVDAGVLVLVDKPATTPPKPDQPAADEAAVEVGVPPTPTDDDTPTRNRRSARRAGAANSEE